MIYIFNRMDLVTDTFINDFLPNMPIERQDRTLRYRRKIDRDLCVIGYWLLCYGLRKEYGITDYPRLLYGDYGKPHLTDYPDIHFNISHCNIGVACAISQNEVGVDIQDVQHYNANVAKRICTDEEMAQLTQCQHPEALFCRLWTIKESFLKQFGASIECLENKASAEWLMSQAPGYVFTHWGEGYNLCCFGGERDISFVEKLVELFNCSKLK